eukprot:138193_1
MENKDLKQSKCYPHELIHENTYKSNQGELEHKLRNEWIIGSKCMVFSTTFEFKWIYTTIEKIENKNDEEILTVKNYGNKYENISFNRWSNNIKPIYIEEKENKSETNDKWTDLLDENMISNSLYVTQNLLKNKENETRIKWNIGNILIIFNYKESKWVKGKIKNMFIK